MNLCNFMLRIVTTKLLAEKEFILRHWVLIRTARPDLKIWQVSVKGTIVYFGGEGILRRGKKGLRNIRMLIKDKQTILIIKAEAQHRTSKKIHVFQLVSDYPEKFWKWIHIMMITWTLVKETKKQIEELLFGMLGFSSF